MRVGSGRPGGVRVARRGRAGRRRGGPDARARALAHHPTPGLIRAAGHLLARAPAPSVAAFAGVPGALAALARAVVSPPAHTAAEAAWALASAAAGGGTTAASALASAGGIEAGLAAAASGSGLAPREGAALLTALVAARAAPPHAALAPATAAALAVPTARPFAVGLAAAALDVDGVGAAAALAVPEWRDGLRAAAAAGCDTAARILARAGWSGRWDACFVGTHCA